MARIRSRLIDGWRWLRGKKNFLHHRILEYSRTHRMFRRRRNGFSKYTVISSVYNMETYLPDYFRTLTEQILDFKTHIHCILVDDGSTDSSAAVIAKWQQRYPDNITYLYKERGGQGAAHNLALPLATTPWVTFIAPDDFVDIRYFWHVDTILRKYSQTDKQDSEIKLLACNIIVFDKKKNGFSNTRPLRHCFTKSVVKKPIDKMNTTIQFPVYSTFFPSEELRKLNLRFIENQWANFEDTDFALRYLVRQQAGCVVYARAPQYYYRKHADNNSSLDAAWFKHEHCVEQQRNILNLLDEVYADLSHIPSFIQYTVMYHMSWQVKHQFCLPPPSFLSPDAVSSFFDVTAKIFSYIDPKLIYDFPQSWSGLQEHHHVGVLGRFAAQLPPETKVHVEKYDRRMQAISLVYYTADPVQEVFCIDGRELAPLLAKYARKHLWEHDFCLRREVWIPLPRAGETLEAVIGGRRAQLRLGNKSGKERLGGAAIQKYLRIAAEESKSGGPWLIMDRDANADDNGEHFYRYVRDHAPEQEIYFVLRSSSPDWERLRKEGFNLVDFGSLRHETILRRCSKLISSHSARYITDYYKNLLADKHYIYLRHGVTKNDTSLNLNTKKIDLLITSTKAEYDSVAADFSPYHFSSREVRLTGIPRHDSLIKNSEHCDNIILVMPTWRKYIVSHKTSKLTSARAINDKFMQTKYFRAWKSFFDSDGLEKMCLEKAYTIIFFPHTNIQPYLSCFSLKPWIHIARLHSVGFQELFKSAKIMITDYSSVAFDMALINRAVLYYQFDRDEFWAGENYHYQKGYFDDVRDGFGPVAEDEPALLAALGKLLDHDGKPEEEYVQRMQETAPFRDGRNCERIYNEIMKL